RPRSERSTSVQPVKRFSRFQSLSPCRMSTSFVVAIRRPFGSLGCGLLRPKHCPNGLRGGQSKLAPRGPLCGATGRYTIAVEALGTRNGRSRMKRGAAILVLAQLVLATSLATAQQKEAAKPADDPDKRLDALVGSWDVAITFQTGPGQTR